GQGRMSSPTRLWVAEAITRHASTAISRDYALKGVPTDSQAAVDPTPRASLPAVLPEARADGDITPLAHLLRRIVDAEPAYVFAGGGSSALQRTQCGGDAGQLVEHLLDGPLLHLVGGEHAVGDLLEHHGCDDRLEDRHHAQRQHHLLRVLHRTQAA